MIEWTEDTGYWSDGAPSWVMYDDEFYARIRHESEHWFWYRVHNVADHSWVDQGGAPTLESAQNHVTQRINWTRFPQDDWRVDEGAIGVTYDDWLRHRIKQHERTKSGRIAHGAHLETAAVHSETCRDCNPDR